MIKIDYPGQKHFVFFMLLPFIWKIILTSELLTEDKQLMQKLQTYMWYCIIQISTNWIGEVGVIYGCLKCQWLEFFGENKIWDGKKVGKLLCGLRRSTS